ncbi:MAG: hypothetical protein M1827_001839 [Pycnora praestabilis]|nr:MAG: hypothetical protein M1827_001839 [Pycnora praestabilis]
MPHARLEKKNIPAKETSFYINGMANDDDDGGDDCFSDDGFDSLPVNTLVELEQNAVQFTQQIPEVPSKGPHPQTYQHLPSQGQDNIKNHPPRVPTLPCQEHHVTGYPRYQPHPSSDYGQFEDLFDAEVLDEAEPQNTVREVEGRTSNIPQRENGRAERYNETSPRHDPQQQGRPGHQNLRAKQDNEYQDYGTKIGIQAQPTLAKSNDRQNGAVDALEAQIEQLRKERELLQKSIDDANATVLSKAGENAILRAKQEKTAIEHRRMLFTLQKLHADEATRQKAEVEAARAEKQRITTENAFLKRDLTEEGERTRNLLRNLRVGVSTTTAAAPRPTTPRKGKSLAYRDGFDDDEITTVSPSKSGGISKPGTPKAGVKRKRKVVEESPGQVLQLSQSPVENQGDGTSHQQIMGEGISRGLKHEEEKYQFIQEMLNHRPPRSQARSFEMFTQYIYPSSPEKPFSSILLDHSSRLDRQKDVEDLPAEFCKILLNMWAQCLKEKYYKPFGVLFDLIDHVLTITTSSTASHLIDHLVPVVQLTGDINAVPRHGGFQPELRAPVNSDIDVLDCLSLLHLVALGCVHQPENIQRFWRLMRFDFVQMMLKPTQPLEEILIMIDMLSTSVFDDTFGSALPSIDQEDQRSNETHLITRVTLLLRDPPIPWADEEAYEHDEIANVKIEVLGLLGALCLTKHGGEALARHSLVIGRLVRLMSEELDSLYDYRYGHEQSARIINLSTRLLYHLLTKFPHLIDMQAKLAIIPGGTHKHLVSLTRLAFSEGLVLEAGIEEEVMDCAHQLLENSITMDEGEALADVFATAR